MPPGLTRDTLLAAVKALEFADYDATKEDAITFFDHYSANGWIMGPGIRMRDWRAAFRSWLNKRGAFDRSGLPRKNAKSESLSGLRKMKPAEIPPPSGASATPEEVEAILKSSGFYDRVQAVGKNK